MMKTTLLSIFLISFSSLAQDEVHQPLFIFDELESEPRMMVVEPDSAGAVSVFTCLKTEFETESDAIETSLSQFLQDHCKLELRLGSKAEFEHFFTNVSNYVEDKKNNYSKAKSIRNWVSGLVIIPSFGIGYKLIGDKFTKMEAKQLAPLISTTLETDYAKRSGYNIVKPIQTFLKSVFRKDFFSKNYHFFEYTYYYSPGAMKEAQQISKMRWWKVFGSRTLLVGGLSAVTYGLIKVSYNTGVKAEAAHKAHVLMTTIQQIVKVDGEYQDTESKTNLSILFRALQDIGYKNWGSM